MLSRCQISLYLRNDAAKVVEGVTASDQEEKPNMNNHELQDKSKDASDNQICDIGEGVDQIVLASNRRGNQRQHGERGHHDNPMDDGNEARVELHEKGKNVVSFFPLLLEVDLGKSDTHDDSKENNRSKVRLCKGSDDVVGHKLCEDTFVHRITQAHIVVDTSRGLDEMSSQIINEERRRFIFLIRANHTAVFQFREEGPGSIAAETNRGIGANGHVAFPEESLHAKNGNETDNRRNHCYCSEALLEKGTFECFNLHCSPDKNGLTGSAKIHSDGFEANASRAAHRHHINNTDDNVDENQRQDDALERADKEVAN